MRPHHGIAGVDIYVGREMKVAGRRVAPGQSCAAALTAAAIALAWAIPLAAGACCGPDDAAVRASAMGCCESAPTLQCAACPAGREAAAARTAWTNLQPERASILVAMGPAVAKGSFLIPLPRHGGSLGAQPESPPLYRLHAQLLI